MKPGVLSLSVELPAATVSQRPGASRNFARIVACMCLGLAVLRLLPPAEGFVLDILDGDWGYPYDFACFRVYKIIVDAVAASGSMFQTGWPSWVSK